MKKLIVVFLLHFAKTENGLAQTLGGIKIFYHDTFSVKGKDIYKELTQVGDALTWSKPEKIDIVLNVSIKRKSASGKVEILIEDFYQPTEINKFDNTIRNTTWVLHKVVYTGNTNSVKADKITVKNIPYQTAYFKSSLLYTKMGFRVVGICFNAKTGEVSRVKKEIYYSE